MKGEEERETYNEFPFGFFLGIECCRGVRRDSWIVIYQNYGGILVWGERE